MAQLNDKYDETILKLFMEKYEEKEESLLWNEYLMALRNNEAPQIPTRLDIRCKELISKRCSF